MSKWGPSGFPVPEFLRYLARLHIKNTLDCVCGVTIGEDRV